MKLLSTTSLAVLSLGSAVSAQIYPCGNCTNESPEPIWPAPAPWWLDCDVYAIPLLPIIGPLPSKAYAPLEKDSTFTQGTYLGVAGALLLVRYHSTPVGPYDELALLPGFWGYQKKRENGLVLPAIGVRGSRFYVSQKYTNYNGRINWNIPKHLARFNWTTHADGSESLEVYPHDTENQPNEDYPSRLPFFKMTFNPLVPGIPLPITTSPLEFLGLSPNLGHPPLPAGQGVYDELPGTDYWAETALGLESRRSVLGTFDMAQGEGDRVGNTRRNAVGDEYYPNWWPTIPRFNVGLKMQEATLSFPVAETWTLD